MSVLVQITAASAALAKASTMTDVLSVKNKAEAIRILLKSVGASLETQNKAAEIKLRAERKAGTLLAEMEDAEGNRHTKSKPRLDGSTMLPSSLAELGITKTQSSRWQAEAKVPDEVFEKWIAAANAGGDEVTQAGLLKVARGTHVSNNSGDNEWYTPEGYIASAKSVMGGIDLDPASSAIANKTVKAKKFYTCQDDGLTKEWSGRVWLNPPYAQPWIAKFAAKMSESVASGVVSQAIVLVNNATETEWWQKVAAVSAAVCFPKTRIRFLDQEGNPGAPLQGQSVIYCGKKAETFCTVFSDFGKCWKS